MPETMQEQEADRAAALGNFAHAREVLEALARSGGGDFDFWRKLSALRKATGDLTGSLAAIEQALSLQPLDFTALLHRALLLEQVNDPRSAQAFGHALAQLPQDGDPPPAMRASIEHARRQWSIHTQAVEEKLSRSVSSHLPRGVRDRALRLASNTAHRTRHFHQQPTLFHYPGVPEIEFHDREQFPQLKILEDATDTIRAEFLALMNAEAAELVPYIQYPAHVPLDQWRELNNNRDWTAIHLLQNGSPVAANARHCPETLAVLSQLDQPQIRGGSPNAMFSLLAPRTTIPPHTGVANTRLVCHLPLIVPRDCGFRVGATTLSWEVGRAFVFDDTIEHEAWNKSDELRVVLILDLWQPCFSLEERGAVTAVIEAAGVSFGGA